MREPETRRAEALAERRHYGVVKPERISQADPDDDTTNQRGIEIDHAAERPKQPDQQY